MDVIQYRKMLAEVSKGVRDHELKAMKFICKDFIRKEKARGDQISLTSVGGPGGEGTVGSPQHQVSERAAADFGRG